MTSALSATCHCGAVRVTIPAAPDYVNECNCTLCLKHGAIWGYFRAAAVTVEGEPERSYSRTDVAEQHVRLFWCNACGCTTHWRLISPADDSQMGVNMRLFDPADIASVEVRYPDGRAWVRA